MSSDSQSPDMLVVDNLSVVYGKMPALENVSFRVRKGTIHAVIGDRGSGKSSLIEVISGAVPKSRGRIEFDGVALDKNSTRKALRLGILTLHQHTSIIPALTSCQNIFLDREIRRYGLFHDKALMRSRVVEAFRFLSIDADPDMPLVFCNLETQQMVEIAKLLCFPGRLLLVDEISSKLSPKNLDKMHYLLSVLLEKGATILYATKDMEEVFNFASYVTVLRGGAVVETSKISSIDKMRLVQLTYSSLYSRKEIESQNLELLYLKNFNDNVVANLPFPLVVADSEGRILAISNLFGKRYGVKKSSCLRRRAPELLEFPDAVWDTIRTRIGGLEYHRTDPMTVHIGNTEVNARLTAIPIADDENSFIGTTLLIEDGGLTTNYDEYLKELSRFSYERSFAYFAHEINNPLGIIANHLKLISAATALKKAQEHGRYVEREVKRVRTIVQRMANRSLLGSNPLTAVRIDKLVGEVFELLKPTLRTQMIDLRVENHSELEIKSDASGVRQVVINLALNAIEAVQKHGTIVIRTVERELNGKKYAVIEVEDNGRGIRPENLEKIFLPSYSTKADGERHGMGLAVCQELTNQMAGVIQVQSTVDKGSLFSVFLPIAAA